MLRLAALDLWCLGIWEVCRYSQSYSGSHGGGGGGAPGAAAAAAAAAATSGAVRKALTRLSPKSCETYKLSRHEEASHSNVQRLLMSESV